MSNYTNFFEYGIDSDDDLYGIVNCDENSTVSLSIWSTHLYDTKYIY